MKSIILSHNKQSDNKQILTPKNKQVVCNFRAKNSCPLHTKCLTSQFIYQANVTILTTSVSITQDLQKQFSKKHSNHKSSFKNENSKNSKELLKYVWSLIENKTPSIKWKIVKIVNSKATSSFGKLF